MQIEKKKLQNYSDNLNENENKQLGAYLSDNNLITQATGIVQLFASEKPDHKKWKKLHTGILCFIKDFNRHSFYFQIYNLNMQLLWEQELYKPFSYNKLTSNFYYFHADDCISGFNFTSQNESEKFNNIISQRIDKMKIREKKKQVMNQPEIEQQLYLAPSPVQVNNISNYPLSKLPVKLNQSSYENNPVKPIKKNNLFGKISSIFSSKPEEKKPISKLSISGPTNFEHKQHVGANASSTGKYEYKLLENDLMTAEMKKILEAANLPVNEQTTQELKNYIVNHYDVEQFALEIYEKIESEQELNEDIQAPSRVVNDFNNINNNNNNINHYNVPSKNPPPPPIPPNPHRKPSLTPSTKPPPPPPFPGSTSSLSNDHNVAPPPIPPNPHRKPSLTPSTKPPPPPPFPGSTSSLSNDHNVAPPPPPPPFPDFTSPNKNDDQKPSFLNEIASAKLTPSKNPPKDNNISTGNSALLDSIRGFKGGLKPISQQNDNKKIQPSAPTMRDQLIAHLGEMRKHIVDSEDEIDDDESDPDW